MVSMTIDQQPPPGRGLTVADIESVPDEGRWELIDGVLMMSPPVEWRHDAGSHRIRCLVEQAAPAEFIVLGGPAATIIDDRTWVEPDVFVGRRSDLGEKWLDHPPVLAVEVLSPSSRLYDLNTKFERYQRARIPSYWVFDPDPAAPRLLAWQLRGGRYVVVADVTGEEPFTATSPFEVTLTPARLLD